MDFVNIYCWIAFCLQLFGSFLCVLKDRDSLRMLLLNNTLAMPIFGRCFGWW